MDGIQSLESYVRGYCMLHGCDHDKINDLLDKILTQYKENGFISLF